MSSDLKLSCPRFSRLIAAAIVALASGPAPVAHAEGPDLPGQSGCARLGDDFVAVSGARGCVRINGHVRAEPLRARTDSMAYPMSFGAVSEGVRHASETYHVRAGAPAGGWETTPR
jgi:hypothetical protein